MAVYLEGQRAAAPSPAPTGYGRERIQFPGGRAFTAVSGWPKPSVAACSWSPKVRRTWRSSGGQCSHLCAPLDIEFVNFAYT
jgi:hypothetical protein